MKNILALIITLISLQTFTQEYSNKNKFKIYFPVHDYTENIYGNPFIKNGIALGVQYTRIFEKQKIGLFSSLQFNYLLPNSIKFNKEYIAKNYLKERFVSLFSIGIEKPLFKHKNFHLDSRYFFNFRLGSKVVVSNNYIEFDYVAKKIFYRDFGVGASLSFNYDISNNINIGLDYSMVGYLVKYITKYKINGPLPGSFPPVYYDTTDIVMYYTIFTTFKF